MCIQTWLGFHYSSYCILRIPQIRNSSNLNQLQYHSNWLKTMEKDSSNSILIPDTRNTKFHHVNVWFQMGDILYTDPSHSTK